MMTRVSASKLPLLRHCAWWARPDVALPPNDPSASAELGTALHAVAEGATPMLPDEVDADELGALVDSYRAWWPGYAETRRWEKEVPSAFDAHTGRVRRLGNGGQGHYPEALPDEIPGTCDAVAPDEVLDLKTGRPPKTLAVYREQLAHAAVCLSRDTGASEVRATVAHVTPSGVYLDSAVLDAIEIAEATEWMREAWAGVPAAEPQPGPWCRDKFCPALTVCPETRAVLAAVPEVRRLPLIGDVESDADAWALIDALPRFEAWVKERRAAIKRRALERGVLEAPDGRRYRIAIATRETLRLDVDGAIDALRTVLGEYTEAALTIRTSKDAVKRAARTAGMPLAATERRAVEALRAIGAVRVSEYDEPTIEAPALPAKDGGEAA